MSNQSKSSEREGLHELATGVYAYLQPRGGWGWSNAGLISDGESGLLVDTLFDTTLTRRMLLEMEKADRGAQQIKTVVNTHSNGDHCWGNRLVDRAEIVASCSCAKEMAGLTPKDLGTLLKVAKILQKSGFLGKGIANLVSVFGAKKLRYLAEAAPFVLEAFGAFDFKENGFTPPTRTFEKELYLQIGDRVAHLINVGPAHTKGDVIVQLLGEKIVFTGDILFAQAHPVIWEGPVSNWMRACRQILDMDIEIVVPGHGPLSDKQGVQNMLEYLEGLHDATKQCFDAGLSAHEAIRSVQFDQGAEWGDKERLSVNVRTLYREFEGDTLPTDIIEEFAEMAKYWKELRQK